MVDDFVKKASSRKKRSLSPYYEHYNNLRLVDDFVESGTKEKRKRENRDYAEIDRAYSKYYEKIKARYRNYVKNLFSNQRNSARNSLINNSYPMQPVSNGEEDVRNTRKIQVQDGRWFNNPEFRYRALHKARSFSNDLQSDESDTIQPVAIPNINDQSLPANQEVFIAPNMSLAAVSNYYPSYISGNNNPVFYHNSSLNQERINEEPPEKELKKQQNPADIAANIFAQLQSQIVRRKRETDDDGKDDDVGGTGTGGKKKTRGPCEPLLNIDHMQIEIVKQAKNPNESFGHGMVLKITCDSGYNSNVQTANSTVRCNKGNWKPVKPSCSLSMNVTSFNFFC